MFGKIKGLNSFGQNITINLLLILNQNIYCFDDNIVDNFIHMLIF
jgi:hypothetical protein